MGVPLVEGRFLRPEDVGRGQRLCVVDDTFSRHYWPNGGAVGQQIYRGDRIGQSDLPLTVVGVVGTVKQARLTDSRPRGSIFFSYDISYFRNFFLVARTSMDPEALGTTLEKKVRQADPDMPLTDIRTMEVRISDSLAPRRSPALMAAIFASAALLLATIGLYGVMAYAVAQRTREFGVRIALGARPLDILKLVFGEGTRLATVGLLLGALGALTLTKFMSSMLYGVQPNDPIAYAGVAGLLALVAGLACFLPARHATKVDPMVALRAD